MERNKDVTSKGYYITTPIYYVNDQPHIGHAYTTIACDVAARFFRQQAGSVFDPDHRRACAESDSVFFLTGTDEHGTKVAEAAQAKGVTPAEFVKTIAEEHFKKTWLEMNLTFNDFIRTDEDRHKTVVQGIFKRLLDSGDISLSHYEGWYWVSDESFVTETQIKELGLEKKKDVRWSKEESYVFHAERYRERIIGLIEKDELRVRPLNRKKEILALLKQWPMEPVSVSRTSVPWGIPVPGNEAHTVYVWFDALINYVSAIGYNPSAAWQDQSADFKRWWPADCHMIGKEILKFHAVIWPAMLIALDLPLPAMVFAHGWWTRDGEKMSKSKGNFVRPQEFIQRYGLDPLRYYLFREMAFGNDGDFSESRMIAALNAELANDLGNLLSRILTMIEKYSEGLLHRPTTGEWLGGSQINLTADEITQAYQRFDYTSVLERAGAFVRRANGLIDQHQPWSLAKDPAKKDQLNDLLYTLADHLRLAAVLYQPFMPVIAHKIWRQLGLTAEPNLISLKEALAPCQIPDGTQIQKGEALFPRIEPKKEKEEQAASKSEDKPKDSKQKNQPKEEKAEEQGLITIDDFAKIDLRIATILSAEKHPNADKLLKLMVDDGTGTSRQLVAGIAAHYNPDDLVGKQVIIAANLKPVKLRGVESRGMVLAASTPDGKLVLTGPGKEITPGARVK